MNGQQQVTPRQLCLILGGVGVFVVFMFGFVGYMAWQERAAHVRAKALFEARLADYLAMPQPRRGELQLGVPRGKMVLVDVEKTELDEMHHFCREAAATPDEVETVVWLRWDTEWVSDPLVFGGYHSDGWKCTVSVFDYANKRLIAQKDFRSKDGDSKPEHEILTWLESLRGK